MRSQIPIRAAKICYIAVSAVLCVLGLLMILKPAFSMTFIGIFCGILMIVFGAVKLAGFFSRDLYRLAFQYDLVSGILLMVLGAILLVRPAGFMNFAGVAIGIFVLGDGLFKLQTAFDAKQFGIRRWWAILIPAVLCVVFGAVLVFVPYGGKALTVVMGIDLFFEGVLNICTVITAVKISKNQKRDDYFETDYREK